MGLFRSIGRALFPKSLAKYDPIGRSLGLYGKPKDKGAELAAQQSAAMAAESSRIEKERAKIAKDKEAVQNNLNMRNRTANRRRVRGGLFGDTTVDQNVQARLG